MYVYRMVTSESLSCSLASFHPLPTPLQYDPMVRLVAAYHEDLLVDTHLHLAKVCVCSTHTLYRAVHGQL